MKTYTYFLDNQDKLKKSNSELFHHKCWNCGQFVSRSKWVKKAENLSGAACCRCLANIESPHDD